MDKLPKHIVLQNVIHYLPLEHVKYFQNDIPKYTFDEYMNYELPKKQLLLSLHETFDLAFDHFKDDDRYDNDTHVDYCLLLDCVIGVNECLQLLDSDL